MLRTNQLKIKTSYLAMGLLLCAPVYAQQQVDQPRGTRAAGGRDSRAEEPSELALENLGRVAASATQIRWILVKDEGLLVELKRWVAIEATDNGQVLDDSTLTDQAIFDRLEQNLTFGSFATWPLQGYEYLTHLPIPYS